MCRSTRNYYSIKILYVSGLTYFDQGLIKFGVDEIWHWAWEKKSEQCMLLYYYKILFEILSQSIFWKIPILLYFFIFSWHTKRNTCSDIVMILILITSNIGVGFGYVLYYMGMVQFHTSKYVRWILILRYKNSQLKIIKWNVPLLSIMPLIKV